MRTNLAIVVKVCFEYILNICRIRGVYLVSQWAEQPVVSWLGYGELEDIRAEPKQLNIWALRENPWRIRGVYLVSQWAEQPVGLVLGSKSSHIVVQPIEVE
nr:hypothetical protein CFP56_58579 [Quercus suber]